MQVVLQVMAGLSGSYEKECSLIIVYCYSASIVTWTVGIMVFLSVLPEY